MRGILQAAAAQAGYPQVRGMAVVEKCLFAKERARLLRAPFLQVGLFLLT